MIGNDIVDIRKAYNEGSWKRKGFIDKVFTNSELRQIASTDNKFNSVWRMWSMKESVYKVIIQAGKERFLNPQSLVCSFYDEQKGFVIYEGKSYETKSLLTNKFIYSCHTSEKHTEVIDEILVVKDPSEQGKVTRLALFRRVADMFEYPIKKLSIRKNKKGVPKLYNSQFPLGLHLSLTHHGNYAAYAINALKGTRPSIEWR